MKRDPESLQERIAGLEPRRRELLEQLLRQKKDATTRVTTISRRKPSSTPPPLSFAQQRIWFLDQLVPGSNYYNEITTLRLPFELDMVALQSSVNEIVHRHEALRTTFCSVDGQPAQVIVPALELEIPVIDLRCLPAAEREQAAVRLCEKQVAEPFDLAKGPLLRMAVVQLDQKDYVFVLTMHHIVWDSWTLTVFFRELTALYKAYSAGLPSPLTELAIQYADFAVWQRAQLQGELLERELAYWKVQLADLPVLQLTTDRPRPAVQTFRGARERFAIPEPLGSELRRLSNREGVTLFMTMLAVFQALLYRYTGQEDLVVGTPVANRTRAEIEDLIGFFVNTLVIRTNLAGDPTFRELLARVRAVALGAYAHQELPFEKLVEELQPERDRSRNPLFQVVFQLFNDASGSASGSNGVTLPSLDVQLNTARFDLRLVLLETGLGLNGYFEYSTDLFDQRTIERMSAHYLAFLRDIAANPDCRISKLRLLTDLERRTVLEGFNATAHPVAEVTLPQLFEAQVARTPEAIAVVCGEESLRYGELKARANRLAHHLIAQGVGPESLVGIALERSIELVVALLAVLKAGGAYVPLDPDYPQARLAHMLLDAAPVLVLSAEELRARLPVDAKVLNLDGAALQAALAQGPAHDPSQAERACPLQSAHPAYVIYTSGSTGTPKGAPNTHQGLINRLLWMQDAYGLDPTDRVLQKTPYSFDVSVWEFFWPLLFGAKLVVTPPGKHRDPQYLVEAIVQQRVTTLHFVPSMLRAFLGHPSCNSCLGLRRVICSGEALGGDLQAQFFSRFPGVELHNLYGPTEAAIDVTAYACHCAEGEGAPPIGAPIWNTRVYVLDGGLELAPVGVCGELYVAGAGLARGYLKRPALTAERFVADPYGPEPGSRMYRTGDLARWRPDGNLEFLGRVDQQIKLRGFRIEPGEIEAALRAQAGVAQAAVIARQDGPDGGEQLVAYATAVPGATLEVAGLRRGLSERLPGYMVPAAFVLLERLPLTANGKLDRAALPAPERPSAGAYRAPRTPEEQLLCGLFGEVLGLERVGIDDNFFALGGHSLLVTRLASRVRSTLEVELAVPTLFEAPSVVELAKRLRQLRRADAVRAPLIRQARPERLPLSHAQQRLWFLDQLEGGASPEYNMPEALRLVGPLDRGALERALDTIVDRHESLRTRFGQHEGQPVQLIAPALRIGLALQDLSGLDPAAQRQAVAAALGQESRQPFDLAREPMLRIKLLKLAQEEHILLRTCHHIVSDGWSGGVFNRELVTLYEAFQQGGGNPLAPLPVQYADFALWQRGWLDQATVDRSLAYWKEQLAGIPPQLALPTDRPRPAQQTFGADVCAMRLSASQLERLKRFSQGQGATLYMGLLSAFGLLLARYSGQEDIVIGSPIANRQEAQLEVLIGFFVNSLAMRLRVQPGQNFRELLGAVRATTLEAYLHQDIPFERLVEELAPERSLSRTPVFQVVFTLQNAPAGPQRVKGLEVGPVGAEELRVRFDLEVYATEQEAGGLELLWLYNRDLFDRWRIEQMARHYVGLLEAALAQPEAPVQRLDILGPEERRRVLEGFNATGRAVAEATLPALFEAQVARTPETIAVVCGEESLSYGELNARANRLAHYLMGQGVGPESLVGIALERSVEMVVGLLAVLKAGGAYVPLDPDYPQARLAHMLADADPALVLSAEWLRARLPASAKVLSLDGPGLQALLTQAPAHDPSDSERTAPLLASHPAYVIYTSGSTGAPKGVVVAHQELTRYLAWAGELYEAEHGLGAPLNSPLAFDATITGLYVPLLAGRQVILLPENQSLEALAELLASGAELTLVKLTPAHLQSLQGLLGPRVSTVRARRFVVGGEALKGHVAAFWRQHAPQLCIVNEYGPTETVVGCCVYELGSDVALEGEVLIGRPTPNTRLYVLDGGLEPVPVGVAGELYIGGSQVGSGYLKQPALTAERFVADPYGPEPGGRMYRTGDLARWRPEGSLEFLGRVDQQLKVRGFRIEPGEIEAALTAQAGVVQAAVLAREDGPTGGQQLVAYVVAAPGAALEAAALRRGLAERLPGYMVPAAFVPLERLPLTANGKLDRAALPAPDRPSAGAYRAPRTPEEQLLCGLFVEVLGLERVGIDDNFFALGGHSLLATQLVSRVRATFRVELSLRDVFAARTLQDLSVAIQTLLFMSDGSDAAKASTEAELEDKYL
jgi:amino acid adenylation domain-containing protein